MAAKRADKAIEYMTVGQAMDFRKMSIAKGVSRIQIQLGGSILATALDAIKEGVRTATMPTLDILWLWTLTSDGRTADQLITSIQAKGRKVSDYAKGVMAKAPFTRELTSGVTYRMVGIRGDEFSDEERTTANIFAEAARRRYRKPPAFLAALLREKFSQERLGFPYVCMGVMHEPIDSSGDPHILGLDCNFGRDWLCTWNARPESKWSRGHLFVFLAPLA